MTLERDADPWEELNIKITGHPYRVSQANHHIAQAALEPIISLPSVLSAEITDLSCQGSHSGF